MPVILNWKNDLKLGESIIGHAWRFSLWKSLKCDFDAWICNKNCKTATSESRLPSECLIPTAA